MAIPFFTMLTPIIDKALSFIPDPEAKERARRELHAQMLESEGSFRKFVVDYEGRGDQVHPAVQIYRASVRPTLTYAFAATFIYGFVNPELFKEDTMTLLFQLNLMSLGFWYGPKAAERLGLDLSGLFKKGTK